MKAKMYKSGNEMIGKKQKLRISRPPPVLLAGQCRCRPARLIWSHIYIVHTMETEPAASGANTRGFHCGAMCNGLCQFQVTGTGLCLQNSKEAVFFFFNISVQMGDS